MDGINNVRNCKTKLRSCIHGDQEYIFGKLQDSVQCGWCVSKSDVKYSVMFHLGLGV